MKNRDWTPWEKYLPSAKVQTRARAAVLHLKPWNQILPEDGAVERMGRKEPVWRPG